MEKKKLNLVNIKNVLSKEELREIKAGSGPLACSVLGMISCTCSSGNSFCVSSVSTCLILCG